MNAPRQAPQKLALPGVRDVVAVASGKGGVGKSTVALGLALALKREGAEVGLLDADIYGPSQGLMLGVSEGHRPRMIDGQRFEPMHALGLQCMSMSFLASERTPMVWRAPMATSALRQLLGQTAWDDLDVLIVDMPPGTGDIQLTMAQSAPVSGAVIVTTPQEVALIDARKGIEMFRKVGIPVLGVIENMSVFVCPDSGKAYPLFGEGGGTRLAAEYEAPLLAQLPLVPGLGEGFAAEQTASSAATQFAQAAATLRASLSSEADLARGPTISIQDD